MNNYASVKVVNKFVPHEKCWDVWYDKGRLHPMGYGEPGNEVILMDNTQPQKIEIPAEVREYIEGILKDANMTTLDESMHEEMISELFARLDSYMTSVIVENMPPENLDDFIKMNAEKKPREEIETYLRDKLPNAQDVMTKAFMDFRDMYLRNVTVARNAPSEEKTKGGDS